MEHDSLISTLRAPFAAAIARVAGCAPDDVDPMLRPAGDPRFGDYQCNAAMPLAKPLRSKPRDIAERIVAEVQPALADVAEPLEVAGPGFINIRVKDAFLARYLGDIPGPPAGTKPDRLGMPPAADSGRVVVDYSCPNIAKQMHVGHLRSTIIGDVFARVIGFEGHEVVRQNHVGDWGTQFGMLIRWYEEHELPTPETHDDVLQAIEDDYKSAQQRFKGDAEFAAAAREAVGRLQRGEPEARRVWEQVCQLSRFAFLDIYRRLGVLLTDTDVRGESFYNDRLADVVAELRDKLGADPAGRGAAPSAAFREDRGAQCVFLYDEQGAPAYKNADGEPLPLIVQKSDGAFLYATTDLAALRYRLTELGARRVVYVTDARQKLHFQMVFATARAMGWITDGVSVEHVTFGSVLGDDRRPLKTREGENVKLRALLDEAERRAQQLLDERAAEGGLAAADSREVARAVGIAAVKYADLRQDRTSDYVFSWDKMLAFQGNTAPYMMYAYARVRSIYRKAAEEIGAPDVYVEDVILTLGHDTERSLAMRLARFREVIDAVAADLQPHALCAYLYDLAGDFMRFYESCPVLKAPDVTTRLARMRLCDLAARTLKCGLGLLGIETIERM